MMSTQDLTYRRSTRIGTNNVVCSIFDSQDKRNKRRVYLKHKQISFNQTSTTLKYITKEKVVIVMLLNIYITPIRIRSRSSLP